MNPLSKAIEIVGGQAALARLVGVTVQAVNQWVRKGRVPAERVIAIERATNGKIARHALRPDIYPPEDIPKKAAAA